MELLQRPSNKGNIFRQNIPEPTILPSGAYVPLYMRDCSHYDMREHKWHLSCGFPQAVHISSENAT